MGGLLYKDFLAIRGKKVIGITGGFVVLFIVLRIVFPGTMDIPGMTVVNDSGQVVNIIDTFFTEGVWCYQIMALTMINGWVSKIVQCDEKNKLRGYIASMPFEKKVSIASKYVFIGIEAYVFLSLYFIMVITCGAFMREGFDQDLLQMGGGFAIPLFCLALLSAAIELPLFIVLGKETAMMVKVGIILGIGLLVIYYLMFGDLTIFDRLDFKKLLEWAEAHSFELVLLNILSPVITLAIYYGSYRVTCLAYGRRERAYE